MTRVKKLDNEFKVIDFENRGTTFLGIICYLFFKNVFFIFQGVGQWDKLITKKRVNSKDRESEPAIEEKKGLVLYNPVKVSIVPKISLSVSLKKLKILVYFIMWENFNFLD